MCSHRDFPGEWPCQGFWFLHSSSVAPHKVGSRKVRDPEDSILLLWIHPWGFVQGSVGVTAWASRSDCLAWNYCFTIVWPWASYQTCKPQFVPMKIEMVLDIGKTELMNLECLAQPCLACRKYSINVSCCY